MFWLTCLKFKGLIFEYTIKILNFFLILFNLFQCMKVYKSLFRIHTRQITCNLCTDTCPFYDAYVSCTLFDLHTCVVRLMYRAYWYFSNQMPWGHRVVYELKTATPQLERQNNQSSENPLERCCNAGASMWTLCKTVYI